MSKTYAIPDLHGRYDLLNSALLQIKDRVEREKATIVFLGTAELPKTDQSRYVRLANRKTYGRYIR